MVSAQKLQDTILDDAFAAVVKPDEIVQLSGAKHDLQVRGALPTPLMPWESRTNNLFQVHPVVPVSLLALTVGLLETPTVHRISVGHVSDSKVLAHLRELIENRLFAGAGIRIEELPPHSVPAFCRGARVDAIRTKTVSGLIQRNPVILDIHSCSLKEGS
jgi:hypothetical protein